MAKQDELLNFEKKRKVLFGEKTSDQEMFETGCEFMEAERFDDALEFFDRTEAEGVEDKIREIAERARENGNSPLFLRAKTVLGETATEDELEEIAQTALSKDCPTMALTAYKKGGMEEKAETLESQLFGQPEQKEEDEPEEEENSE